MGGHGGLNILPQKRWNVYNFDNREKVRKDEEAAAKEEQLKREQSRKRDFELRLVQLRQARGLAPSAQASSPSSETKSKSESKSKSPELESISKLNHINLFEGIKIFDPVVFGGEGKGEDEGGAFKKMKMAKKEAAPRVVMPEDEKYRLGYGIAGKGVKLPWYLSKPNDDANVEKEDDDHHHHRSREGAKSGVKKTLEQLREERLKREKKEKEREQALMLEKRFNRDKKEKERERALILEKGRRDVPFLKDRGFSRRSGK